jgi:hypothetical protein
LLNWYPKDTVFLFPIEITFVKKGKHTPLSYVTIILRLWEVTKKNISQTQNVQQDWRGQIQNVRTGQIINFQGLDRLSNLLNGQLTENKPEHPLPGKKIGLR